MSYKNAKGVLPWKEGDELPEETIKRMRGGAMDKGKKQHTPEMECKKGHRYWVMDWTPEMPEEDYPDCPLCNHDRKSGYYPIPYVVAYPKQPEQQAILETERDQARAWAAAWKNAAKFNYNMVQDIASGEMYHRVIKIARLAETSRNTALARIEKLIEAGDRMERFTVVHAPLCSYWTSTPRVCSCELGEVMAAWKQAKGE